MSDFPTFAPPDHFKFAIGELYQTRMSLSRYEAGEIMKINNVLAGTHLKIEDERIDELEATTLRETETETEREQRDSASTQSMMRQSAQTLQSRSQSVQAGAEAEGTYGAMTVSAYGDFGTNQSASRAQEQAAETATEVVSESRERTKTRTLESLSTRALTVKTQRSEYGIDNSGGDHVVGITRLVDEIHRVEMLRHGRHLFANILIANPAAHYRAYLDKVEGDAQTAETGDPPEAPQWNGQVLKAQDIEPDEWLALSSHFGVEEALPPPPETVSVSGQLDFESPKRPSVGHDAIFTSVQIPEGYKPARMHTAISAVSHDDKIRTRLYVGGRALSMTNPSPAEYTVDFGAQPTRAIHQLLAEGGGTLDIGMTASNAYEAGVTFVVECELVDGFRDLWKFDLYRAIVEANANGGTETLSGPAAISGIGVTKVDYTNNPRLAREFVQSSLRRSIIQQVGGTLLDGFEVFDPASLTWPDYPDVDLDKLGKVTPIVQFLDTLFDFEKMTMRYVDGYLGDRDNRDTFYQGLTPGPMKAFLESTFARIILPIARFGDNELKFRWFQSTGQVFFGEDVPVFDDPLSLAILDELEGAQALESEEPEVLRSWEITLPSPHTILQADATLPDFVAAEQPKLATGSQPIGRPDPVE